MKACEARADNRGSCRTLAIEIEFAASSQVLPQSDVAFACDSPNKPGLVTAGVRRIVIEECALPDPAEESEIKLAAGRAVAEPYEDSCPMAATDFNFPESSWINPFERIIGHVRIKVWGDGSNCWPRFDSKSGWVFAGESPGVRIIVSSAIVVNSNLGVEFAACVFESVR